MVNKNSAERFYLEWGREKRRLESTRAILEVWHEVVRRSDLAGRLDELEEIVREKARMEWGTGTIVTFTRDKATAEVFQTTRGNRYVFPGEMP